MFVKIVSNGTTETHECENVTVGKVVDGARLVTVNRKDGKVEMVVDASKRIYVMNVTGKTIDSY